MRLGDAKIGRHGPHETAGIDAAIDETGGEIAALDMRAGGNLVGHLWRYTEPGEHAAPFDQFREEDLRQQNPIVLLLPVVRQNWKTCAQRVRSAVRIAKAAMVHDGLPPAPPRAGTAALFCTRTGIAAVPLPDIDVRRANRIGP